MNDIEKIAEFEPGCLFEVGANKIIKTVIVRSISLSVFEN